MKTYVFDGNKFNDLNGFFYEFSKVMMAENLVNITLFDQYDDLLEGGYGTRKIGEPICIKWITFQE